MEEKEKETTFELGTLYDVNKNIVQTSEKELSQGVINSKKEEIKNQIKTFRKYYSLIQDGIYYRLTSPYEDEEYTAWEFVSEDKQEALISIVNTKLTANGMFSRIKLRGLNPDLWYSIDNTEYPGAALMEAGLPLPVPSFEYESWNLHVKAINQ